MDGAKVYAKYLCTVQYVYQKLPDRCRVGSDLTLGSVTASIAQRRRGRKSGLDAKGWTNEMTWRGTGAQGVLLSRRHRASITVQRLRAGTLGAVMAVGVVPRCSWSVGSLSTDQL